LEKLQSIFIWKNYSNIIRIFMDLLYFPLFIYHISQKYNLLLLENEIY
jgi:hypothetical protein